MVLERKAEAATVRIRGKKRINDREEAREAVTNLDATPFLLAPPSLSTSGSKDVSFDLQVEKRK